MRNVIMITGRLCADPEPKATQSSTAMAVFRVAVDCRFGGKGADKKTDFFNCVAFGKTAEFITTYFHKGDGIELVGSMESDEWTDRDGQKRTGWKIRADMASFPPTRKADAAGTPAAEPSPMVPVDESDLPF